MPDAHTGTANPFKPTITDVFRPHLVDRQNKVPLNPAGYKKKFSEATSFHDLCKRAGSGVISRGADHYT